MTIKEYVQQQEKEARELLLTLARIPAFTGEEGKRAEFCLDWIRRNGGTDAWIDSAGNVQIPYRIKEQNPLIVFMAHMDVVFPDREPLPLVEKGGRIFCPGIYDNTVNLVHMLMAARYILQEQIETGENGFLFVCSVGEEGLGNLKGCREICTQYASRIRCFTAFDLTDENYTARAVGSLRYQIAADAIGGHSFLNFGRTNAIQVLAELITSVYQISVPDGKTTTYNVGVIKGGTTVNAIAQHAELLFEIRSENADQLAWMQEQFQRKLNLLQKKLPDDVKVTVRLLGERPCEKGIDETIRQQLFERVRTAVYRITGAEPKPQSCSTDCNMPLSMGIPSVCIGTCRGVGAHTREEYLEADSLKNGFQLTVEVVMEILKWMKEE